MKPTKEELLNKIKEMGGSFEMQKKLRSCHIPVREVKPVLMKEFKISSKEFDEIILKGQNPFFHEKGICYSWRNFAQFKGRRNHNYVTKNPDQPTLMNSFGFFQIKLR